MRPPDWSLPSRAAGPGAVDEAAVAQQRGVLQGIGERDGSASARAGAVGVMSVLLETIAGAQGEFARTLRPAVKHQCGRRTAERAAKQPASHHHSRVVRFAAQPGLAAVYHAFCSRLVFGLGRGGAGAIFQIGIHRSARAKPRRKRARWNRNRCQRLRDTVGRAECEECACRRLADLIDARPDGRLDMFARSAFGNCFHFCPTSDLFRLSQSATSCKRP